jgi:predicted SpoU family rRNA methylase
MTNEYKIKLSEISKKLKKVYNLGYGDTIHLTINGESYEVVNDNVRNKKKKLVKV